MEVVEAGIFKWGGVVEMGDRLCTSYIICCSPNDGGESNRLIGEMYTRNKYSCRKIRM